MYQRLKEVRVKLGMTQQAFGDRLSLKRNTVATYEIGKNVPSDRTIKDICEKFNVNEVWLRTGVGEMFQQRTRAEKMGALFADLLADRPESFRSSLITALMRFDPNSPVWEALEEIYNQVRESYERTRDDAPGNDKGPGP